MVKITNGIDAFEVPTGAYNNTFKKLGYKIIFEKVETPVDIPETSEMDVKSTPIDEFAELLEKPISQWNKHEVKEFAASKGINLVGTKTIDEAKERIKESIGL